MKTRIIDIINIICDIGAFPFCYDLIAWHVKETIGVDISVEAIKKAIKEDTP